MASSEKTPPTEVMVVNDSPGEECRIAILSDNHLEELYTERTSTATNVGNVYKGRVTNVESAIQAAFVDYGQGQAGFLHISDLHPRYFPGAKRTEQVGRKIPRRSRPPIQEALKRGDEVVVQVLKEGIGTKGPTLTSYISIPGRLLVMMPEMDRVGVSRKVEDPEQRRQMRKILDSLKLPEGFGFILRTAGSGLSKTELSRDVAFLMRLWKVMEKRIDGVGAPCELYTESDLFIRTIRDVLRPSIEAIVVDTESAYERATALLRVVMPRSAPKLVLFRNSVPIFHAFDIERQIEMIHCREAPLPSGGKLVIDQTEALVAIDVNSGRSRRARDSETNAFHTNGEAVDEICRQLRLRDLGGLVICDLIDMHMSKHRREIEDRLRQGLSRDRAKTTVLPISEFGIVELTRQRMRPSLRKSHFMPCPLCDGRGEIKNPESVGADVMRQIGYLLQFDRVKRVEVVCSPRVASILISGKRRELVSLEDAVDKKVDVRVSDAIAVDRVDYYGYDERNADIDVSKLPALKPLTIQELLEVQGRPVTAPKPVSGGRSRQRRRRSAPASADSIVEALEYDAPAAEAPAAPAQKAGRRRGRGRTRRARGGESATSQEGQDTIRIHELATELGVASREVLSRLDKKEEVKSHMSSVAGRVADIIRRRFRRVDSEPAAPEAGETKPAPKPAELSKEEQEVKPETSTSDGGRKRRRRRRRRSAASKTAGDTAAAVGEPVAVVQVPVAVAQERPAAEKDSSGQRKKTAGPTRGSRKTGNGGGEPAKRRGRRRRASDPSSRNGEEKGDPAIVAQAVVDVPSESAGSAKPRPKKALYRSRRVIAQQHAQDPAQLEDDLRQ